jgi:hypothetical protein
MNLRLWLVQLYPRAWRQRYGEEFEALLERCLHSPLDVLDILLGALDAHLDFPPGMNWRLLNMNNKLRTAILIVFAAYIAFVVAGMGVYGFADDSPFIPMMQSNVPLRLAWYTIQAGAVVALAAVVIGGAPLAWTIVRRAVTSNRKDLRLLLVPVLAFLAWLLYLEAMIFLSQNSSLLSPPVSQTAHLLLWGWMAVFILGAIASTWAVWRVVSRTDVAEGSLPLTASRRTVRLYEFAVAPSIIATLAMMIMFIASIVWFWTAFLARPDMFVGNQGPMFTDAKAALAGTLLLMAAAVTASIVGLARLRLAGGTRC